MIVGSTIFGIGAALGVPRVFPTSDRQARLRLLEGHSTRWRISQPLYAVGPVIAAVAVGLGLVAGDASNAAATVSLLAAVAIFIGACTWSYGCYLRGARHADFALGKLPGWPLATYVVLTIVGLELLGAGLLATDYPGWLGWLVFAADLAFLALYAIARDIPPFVFYILLTVVVVFLLI